MPRQPRRLSASGVYHIMWRGIDKMQLYCDDADCIHFLSILDFVQNDDFIVLAYCLMGNHVHLLIKTARDTTAPLESTMKKLGMRYAAHYNRRYQRIGPVYQGRYKSQPVESTSYFLRVLRYIHANPVAAGIAPAMDAYRWSSYCDYFSSRKPLCRVDTSYALRLRDTAWLRQWHTRPECNASAMLDTDTPRLTDPQALAIIQQMARCEAKYMDALPEELQQKIFRRLVREEKLPIPQLSRLCGVPRGVIRRCAL